MPGFQVHGFWAALFGWLMLSLFSFELFLQKLSDYLSKDLILSVSDVGGWQAVPVQT